MYICTECKQVFDEPIEWKESRGEYFGSPAYETLVGCPFCYSACTEAYPCDCCEEIIEDTYIKTDDGKRYCQDCYQVYRLGEE